MAIIFNDAGTGNAGILLDTPVGTTGRALVVGTSWSKQAGLYPGTNGTISISSAARFWNSTGGTNAYYFANPPNPTMLDGDVSLDIINIGGSILGAYKGVLWRATNTTGSTAYYAFQYNTNAGQLEFVRVIGTAVTVIQSWTTAIPNPPTLNTTYTLKVQARGNLFAFFVNGVQLTAPAVAGVPANWIQDTGISTAGSWGMLASGPDTDTTGLHSDNFIVSNVPVITVTSPANAQVIAGVGAQSVSIAANQNAGWTTASVFTLFATPGLTGPTAPTVTASPDGLHVTLSVNPGTTTGTLTIADPAGVTFQLTVISNVALSPITPASPTIVTTATVTFTTTVSGYTGGNNAVTWSASVGSITGGGVYTPPAVAGTYTVTAASVFDPSKTATTNVTVVVAPGAPVVTLSSSATLDTVSVQVPPPVGTNPVASLSLYLSDALGTVIGAALATNTQGPYPVSFTPQAAPAPGAFRYYAARATDSAAFVSPVSNVVGRGTTLIAPSNPPSTYLRTFTAPYGPGATSQPLGYTVFDLAGAILAPRTTSGVGEIPASGIFVARVTLDTLWSGVLVWDAPPGGGSYVESFDAAPRLLAPVASRC